MSHRTSGFNLRTLVPEVTILARGPSTSDPHPPNRTTGATVSSDGRSVKSNAIARCRPHPAPVYLSFGFDFPGSVVGPVPSGSSPRAPRLPPPLPRQARSRRRAPSDTTRAKVPRGRVGTPLKWWCRPPNNNSCPGLDPLVPTLRLLVHDYFNRHRCRSPSTPRPGPPRPSPDDGSVR